MASHVKGSDVFGAKLTAGDVLAIRSSTMSNAELAIQLGVSRQAIWSVRKGVTWRHVTNTPHMSEPQTPCQGQIQAILAG